MLTIIKTITAFILFNALFLANASANSQLEKAYQLLESGKSEAALDIAQGVLRTNPKDPDARFLKGFVLAEKGQTTDSIDIFRSLTRDYPNNPEPWNNLASLYAKQEKYHQARDALISAINTHPSYATAYKNLGNIYSKMAVIAYNRALDVNQNEKKKPVDVQLALISRFSNSAGESASSISTQPLAAVTQLTKSLPPVIEEKSIFSYEEEKNQVLAVLYGWSQAWSSQKPADYLIYYSPNFQTPGGMPRSIWEKRRHERLTKPRFIKVMIERPEVTFINDSTARLIFLQDYHSSAFRDKNKKTLMMQKVNGNWRIFRETIGG
ncbi:MAG: tetratricopeptide repeat protein [Gammaproteobacteria bacterium]|nr:tetratricopeptide repeat protein [Gammaproteobacteria bacterium]MDH5593175.1 tetratricopeptide repeat protein [Gammaproteobacteria bacterium]